MNKDLLDKISRPTWEHIDYPHSEDFKLLNLNKDEIKQIRDDENVFATQASEAHESRFFVFQLDAGSFFNGKHFERNCECIPQPSLMAGCGSSEPIS